LGWHNLYQKINRSIYFLEIMWQQDDLDFATSFWRFHTGIPCSPDVDAINSRLMDFNIITMTFEFKPILFTKGISTNTIPYSCHQKFLFNSSYFFIIEASTIYVMTKQIVYQWFWNLCWECPSCAQETTLDPRKLLTAPWVMLLTTNCQKLQLHITKSLPKLLGIYSVCFIHITWNNFHKIA
jgi:hypothetical protein